MADMLAGSNYFTIASYRSRKAAPGRLGSQRENFVVINETVEEWIRSFRDPNDRAEAIIASCIFDENDASIHQLAALSAIGDGLHAGVLRGLLEPAKKRRGRNKEERRRARIHAHHPALGGLGWKRVQEPPVQKNYGGPPVEQKDIRLWSSKPKSEDELAFAAGLATYVYENHKKMWPHLPDLKFPKPAGYTPRGPMVNPFWPAAPAVDQPSTPMRHSWLTKLEVGKVYDAMSYAMFKDGTIMNTHLIIVWSMMGLTPEEGNAVLGKYLHGAQKWLRVGSKPRKRYVSNARSGTELKNVWVHENAPGRGFHSHVLLDLRFELKTEFETWSREYLVKLTKRHFPWKSFRLVPSYAKNETDAVTRAWKWFRYLTKELRPESRFCWQTESGEFRECSTRDIIKPWNYRPNLPVPVMKMTGVSHNIGKGRQKQDQYVSLLRTCQFDLMYTSYKLDERRRRLASEHTAQLMKGLAV